jgi:curli biogenesis system outer membrane secretion channel CsgG
MTPKVRPVLAVLVLLLSSALAACGSDKSGPAASSTSGTSAAPRTWPRPPSTRTPTAIRW